MLVVFVKLLQRLAALSAQHPLPAKLTHLSIGQDGYGPSGRMSSGIYLLLRRHIVSVERALPFFTEGRSGCLEGSGKHVSLRNVRLLSNTLFVVVVLDCK